MIVLLSTLALADPTVDGLQAELDRNVDRLALEDAEAVFIAVGTPPNEDGQTYPTAPPKLAGAQEDFGRQTRLWTTKDGIT